MGSNNNKNQNSGYGPNPGQSSSSDPRGRLQNQSQYQQQRYESQQGPLANQMAMNYGRASEANYGDYTDIMNQYRDIASGGGQGGDDGGGGGGGGASNVSAHLVTPGTAGYNDPFASYGGYQEFSQTGGYSPADIANMRARGVSPIRAAYANAERNIGQQRSLQGGYSPNAIATQAKMAREQGQSMADAVQNVEADLAEKRNAGRLAGLGGMSGIEGQRLNADTDLSKFNVGLDYQGQVYNADAMTRADAANAAAAGAAADRAAYSNSESTANRLRALGGMTSLYGTTPGMSQLFGDQASGIVGQGGQFGLGLYNSDINSQKAPGQFDQTMGRLNQIGGTASRYLAPVVDYFGQRNKRPQTGVPSTNIGMGGGINYGPSVNPGYPPPDMYGGAYDDGQ